MNRLAYLYFIDCILHFLLCKEDKYIIPTAAKADFNDGGVEYAFELDKPYFKDTFHTDEEA